MCSRFQDEMYHACNMSLQCSSGDDFHSWIERCGNIIAGCLWTAAVSWLVLPWFASDSQLEQLADGYVAAVEALQDIYGVFHDSCRIAAEVFFCFTPSLHT